MPPLCANAASERKNRVTSNDKGLRPVFFLLALAAVLLGTGRTAIADQAQAGSWEFIISPYLWTPALDGDIRPVGNVPTASVDLSISDVLDALNFGVMGLAEARKGRFAILGHAFYSNISQKEDITVGPLVPRNAGIKVGAETFFAGLGVGYDIYTDGASRITGMAGLRYWKVENQLRVNSALVNFDRSVSEAWIDPVVGLSGKHGFENGFGLVGMTDIGGMGVGSDLTWSLLGIVTYDVSERATLAVGWRHLEVDYDEDGFLFDVSLSGPLAGVSFRF
jgi:hypothetical protein